MSFNNFPQKGQLAIATINTSVKGSLTLFNLAMKTAMNTMESEKPSDWSQAKFKALFLSKNVYRTEIDCVEVIGVYLCNTYSRTPCM